jgi:hypothetical protein
VSADRCVLVELRMLLIRKYAYSSSEMDESEDMDDVRDDASSCRDGRPLLGGDGGRAQRDAEGEVE